MKRQRRTVGAIVKIPLENEYHTYARILEYGLAFYDSRTKEELPIDKIIAKPVLFVTEVYDIVITKAYWKIIGKKKPIEPHLIELMYKPTFTEDVIDDKIIIHYDDGSEKEATVDEIQGMEGAIIWTHDAMQQRLNDYYAGRKNMYVEAMKLGKTLP